MNWTKIAGINFLLIIVIIVIFELLFGRWIDGDVPLFKYQIFDKTYIDRSELKVYPEQIVIHPESNGFRSSGGIVLSPSMDCLIITMGGSTTQEYILSQDETWSQQLQNEINKVKSSTDDYCSSKYFVLNVGMSGHNIINNLWLLKNYIIESGVKPVAIVVYQGINDWHSTLNKKSKYYEKLPFLLDLRDLYHEVSRDLRYKSFLVGLIKKITRSFNESEGNKVINQSYNNDGLLFKIKNPEKSKGAFIYEKVDSTLIPKSNKWIESQYHKRYIQKFIDTVKESLPKTKLIFITQTQSICDLTNFPSSLGYKKSDNHSIKVSPSKFSVSDWLSNRGTCYRLGLVKTNYISVKNDNLEVKIIEYAGRVVENSDESYDDYHKTPYGSKIFFDRISLELIQMIRPI